MSDSATEIQLPSNWEEFRQRYDLLKCEPLMEIDKVRYWISWKIVLRGRKKKLYVFILKEQNGRFVDIKGFPAELVDMIREKTNAFIEELKKLGLY